MKWGFIVLCLLLLTLLVRRQTIPAKWVEDVVQHNLPTNLVFHLDSCAFGIIHGLRVTGLKLYDLERDKPMEPLASADALLVMPWTRNVKIEGLKYNRLPESYYAPENHEKNSPVEAELPVLPTFSLKLIRPAILGVRPEYVEAEIETSRDRLAANRVHIDWPDQDEKMYLDGFCYVDFGRQEIYGEVDGSARQAHIRPMLVALDVPSALPYMDAFTEVPGKVPSWCGWKVNLVNNDFDLYLRLHPNLGKYNLVPMKHADGNIHLHIYTRDESLNYLQTIGPISAEGVRDERLQGTVVVSGTNGLNTVEVKAHSTLPVAELLRIGGFDGEYVNDSVVGESEFDLKFIFPRAMSNDYQRLNGSGRVSLKNGQVMRLRGFQGLVELLAEKVPGVSWFTDATQATCDYVIENGVVKSDNIYIEGEVFSVKMYGSFDSVNNRLDFRARVQFAKKDSLMGKVLHPLTWAFTKLLLEYRLTGTSDDPRWEYITVIDRVLEVTE